jgi:hypothetical protein
MALIHRRRRSASRQLSGVNRTIDRGSRGGRSLVKAVRTVDKSVIASARASRVDGQLRLGNGTRVEVKRL